MGIVLRVIISTKWVKGEDAMSQLPKNSPKVMLAPEKRGLYTVGLGRGE